MSAADKLPFVGTRKRPRKHQSPRDMWHNVAATGDLEKDQEIGAQYAYMTLQALKADDFPPLLGHVVIDMIENKCPDDIVVGFFQTVADVCLRRREIPKAGVALIDPRKETHERR